jgi:DNA (cytosine-5)-methyltransferase 1
VIENVDDMLTSLAGKDFDRICGMLTEAGYRFGAVAIDAALFVPQSRERLFIIAVESDMPVPSELVADTPMAPFHPPALVTALRRQKATPIWWSLPVPPAHNLILADLLEDAHAVKWDTPAKTDEIIGMMEKPHLDRIEEDKRAGRLIVRSINWRTRGKATRWESRDDLIANCLRTASGGSSVQRLLFVDGASVRTRRISHREYARLMGFGDSYKLPDKITASYNLTGDGVAAPVVRFLAEHLLEPLLQAQLQAPNPAKPIAAHAV